ncbi:uncharacterized protein LOC132293361 [Cornus florida]|uniref:uncharacterized protein LOC132293361 n=1 Tax=Cornus florida TaxID=4283 RepID=UPI002899021F|nr:uncharacterized protein LOC132293361 [Cornus florida]
MFRLHRQTKPSKSGERIDFKFSNFQANKVPKGWDKLFVSIINVETGKTIAKSSKALVRNGICQWAETLSESIWISQDDSSKELEECLFKLVVTMGSARSGILGEAIVNMAGYMSSRNSVPILLPLKKCNHGTVLQVKIHCLTPRTKLRDEESKDSIYQKEDQNAASQDVDSKSNGSDNSFARSAGSSSSKDLGSTSQPREVESRETSFSVSGSHHSFNSAEDSLGRGSVSSGNNLKVDRGNLAERRDSTSFQNSSPHGDSPADDHSQSNQSSFNSKVTGSGDDSQNHWQEFEQSSSHVIPSSSLRNADSSKDLLEAAEDTIDELRAEAKMWERRARKIMLDLDILRKEFSDQSKKHANLNMELSAAHTERDGFKKEVEQLKLILEESVVKQTAMEDSKFQSEGAVCIQKELVNEMKFQQESNVNLALQLKRSQESNIELLTVLQELEDTIEKQKVEIENLSVLQLKFSDMEHSIQENLEENRILSLQLQQLQESENKLHVNVRFLEQALEDKNNEIENERSLNNQALLDIETEYKRNLSAKEEEIASLKANLSQSDETGFTNRRSVVDLTREIETLKEKMEELESDCNELTNENLELLFKLKDLKNNSMRECKSFDSSSSEIQDKSSTSSESEVCDLKSQIDFLKEGLKKRVIEEDQLAAFETSNVFHDLVKQLQIAFCHIKKPWYSIFPNLTDEFESDLNNLENLNSTYMTAPKQWADCILNYFAKLNKLLEVRIHECEEILKCSEVDVADAQKKLEDYILKENNFHLSIQELESSKIELEANLTNLRKEMAEKRSETEKLEPDLLSKEKEINFLRQCQKELEAQISVLHEEKNQLEENKEILQRESNITSKCLDDLRNDLMVLSTSVDSHVSANNILERKSSDLESAKCELELHLLELEEENVQLLERISDLEAQLRCMTDERESARVELENSKSAAISLQSDIRKLEIEMETQKLDLEHKLQDMQNQWSETLEEREYLKIKFQKLVASAESLSEECNTLQKSNRELENEKLELHECCTHLEAELRESRKSFSDCSKQVEDLEGRFSFMLEDFASKESSLTSELNGLLHENMEQKEKLVLGENLFNKMYLEKSTEVENLQREVENLTKQISATHDERERLASEAIHEVSSLLVDKAKLESDLQEVQCKVMLIDSELGTVRMESDLKVQGLMVELAASNQSREILVADHEKMLKLLGNYRSSEEKLKTALNDLELKLTVSEYERQQLIEETANLKVQLQKVAQLQDEILALKNELNASSIEKEKLEASLSSLFGDCEELKAEKISILDKVSSLQNAMSELEDCKRKRVSLEEKLLQMKGDLEAKEALCSQDAELKNELSRIKKSNKQFQQNIEKLQEEKDECLKRAQALEQELKLLEEKQDRSKSRSKKVEMVKSNNHRDNRNKPFTKSDQTQELQTGQKNSYSDRHKRKGDKYSNHDGSPNAVEVDHVAKIQVLENELSEALEANNKYKIQLQRFLSEERNLHAGTPKKSTAEGEVVAKERFERTKSSLESELRDLRERYFNMSLKYAEVEAQREDLVMKLREKNGKRWFS